jgi:preprotein translocase subunit SecG
MGVAFGSGTSAAVFGGRGAGNFLERVTSVTAVVFMLTSMSLAYFASQSDSARLQKLTVERKKKQEVVEQKQADEKAQKEAAERAKTSEPRPKCRPRRRRRLRAPRASLRRVPFHRRPLRPLPRRPPSRLPSPRKLRSSPSTTWSLPLVAV